MPVRLKVIAATKSSDRERGKMSDNRKNIIDATDRLLQTHGLARLTTRKIAREANVAEGLIYHHFKDKADLIHEVVETRMRETINLLQNLPLQVGTRSLPDILEDALYTIYLSHFEIVLLICSIFSDHQLRTRMQEIMKEKHGGPLQIIEGLNIFLAAEQRIGRLSGDVDPQVVAHCLWKICIQSAMEDQLTGRKPRPSEIRREIHGDVETMMRGLAPAGTFRTKQDQKE